MIRDVKKNFGTFLISKFLLGNISCSQVELANVCWLPSKSLVIRIILRSQRGLWEREINMGFGSRNNHGLWERELNMTLDHDLSSTFITNKIRFIECW